MTYMIEVGKLQDLHAKDQYTYSSGNLCNTYSIELILKDNPNVVKKII